MAPECVSSDLMAVESVTAVTSILFNVVLMLLIVFATPKELRDYSRLLLASCVLELFFAAAGYCLETHVFIADDILYFNVKRIVLDSPDANLRLGVLQCFMFYQTFCFVLIPLGYRYYLLSRNAKPSSLLTLFSAAIVISLPAVPALVNYFLMERSMQRTLEALQSSGYIPSCDEPGSGPLYKLEDGLVFPNYVPFATMAAITNVIFCLIAVLTYRTWSLVRKSTTMNRKVRSMQRQLSIVLLVQALTPLFLMTAPITAMMVGCVFGFGAQMLPWNTAATSAIPTADALATIFIIKQYRRTLVKVVKRLFTCRLRRTGPASLTGTSAEQNAWTG